MDRQIVGVLALQSGELLPLQVLESQRGYYLGTMTIEEGPVSRESEEYWPIRDLAQEALRDQNWTQRTQA